MKRAISLMLVVLFVAALFVGCSKSDPVGSYKVDMDNLIKTMKESEESLKDKSDDDIKALLKTAGMDEESMGLEIKKDGTFTLDFMGQTTKGEWKQDGSKLTLTVDGDPAEATIDGDTITLEVESAGMKLVFVKK